MNLPAIAVAIPAELATAADQTGLAADGIASLKAGFAPHFVRFHEVAEAARGVPANAPKKARELRLELRAIRVAADKTRKALKEDSLRRGKAIDGINALLEYQLVPIEDALEAIEKAEELAEAARVAALKEARAVELRPFADPEFYDLGAMPDVQWKALLAGAKAAHEAAEKAKAQAEADRIAAEQLAAAKKAQEEAAIAAERERMRAENERLAAIAAEERKAREAAESKAKAERAEAERLAAVEREKARQEREAMERQAAAEREKAQKALDEAAAALVKKIEEQQAKEAADAKREAEAKAAAKKAAAAPDRQKLTNLAGLVRALPLPTLTTEAGKALAIRITEQRTKFAAWLDAEGARL